MGVEYRLTTTNSVKDVDAALAICMDEIVSLLAKVDADIDDGVARWRSQEEMGFSRRCKTEQGSKSLNEYDGGTSIAHDDVCRMWGRDDEGWEP